MNTAAQEVGYVEPIIPQHEAAQRLGLHVSALIRARRAGELQAVKFGRSVYYRPSELSRWVDAHAEGEV